MPDIVSYLQLQNLDTNAETYSIPLERADLPFLNPVVPPVPVHKHQNLTPIIANESSVSITPVIKSNQTKS